MTLLRDDVLECDESTRDMDGYMDWCVVAHTTLSQVGPDDMHTKLLLDLFVQVAKRDAFHQLRTVEQLGYIVSVSRCVRVTSWLFDVAVTHVVFF